MMGWQAVAQEFRPVWAQVAPVLMHSLWQAGLIAVALWTALKLAPGGRARLRHGMALCALVAVVAAMAGTWAAGWAGRQGLFPGGPAFAPPTKGHPQATGHAWVAGPEVSKLFDGKTAVFGAAPDPPNAPQSFQMDWRDWAALAWALGAAWGLARCLRDMVGARRVMGRAVRVTDPAWLEALERAKEKLGMTQGVALAVSEHVLVPTVVGFLKPMVLIPGFAAPGLTARELRLILAHELAHVKRWDLWVGLFQALVEALLFFNPGVRWISRQVSLERECCCDLDAAGICDAGPVPYVELLAQWVSQGGAATPALTMGLDGGAEAKSPVLERVSRVLFPARRVSRRIPVWALSAGVGAFVLLGFGAGLAAQAVVKAWTPQERVEAVAKAKPAPQEENELWRNPNVYKDVEVKVKAAPGAVIGAKALVALIGQDQWGAVAGYRSWADNKEGVVLFQGSQPRVFRGAVIDEESGFSLGRPVSGLVEGAMLRLEVEAGGGVRRTIHVVDEQGRPVAGAQLLGDFDFGSKAHFKGRWLWKTDAAGTVSFPVASEKPVLIKVFARDLNPGAVILEPGGPVEQKLVMTRGKSLTGRVVWGKTGAPGAGLEIGVIGGRPKADMEQSVRDSGWGMGIGLQKDPRGYSYTPWVKADENGRFTLDYLDPQWQYFLVVQEPNGHTVGVIENVSQGQELGNVSVGRVKLAGRVLDPDGLLEKGKSANFSVGFYYKLGNTSFHGITRPIEMKKKDGQWTFEIPDVIAPTVEVVFSNQTLIEKISVPRLKPGEDMLDLVWDMGTVTGPLRGQANVKVKLKVPDGEPAPVGTMMMLPRGEWLKFTAEDKGEKTVTVERGVPTYSNQFWFPGFRSKKSDTTLWFVNKKGEAPSELVLELEPAGAITGKVVTMRGKPWPLFEMKVESVDARGGRQHAEVSRGTEADKEAGKFAADRLEFGKTYVVTVTVMTPLGQKEMRTAGPYLITREQPVRNVEIVVSDRGK
jgi:hypothetical protein